MQDEDNANWQSCIWPNPPQMSAWSLEVYTAELCPRLGWDSAYEDNGYFGPES